MAATENRKFEPKPEYKVTASVSSANVIDFLELYCGISLPKNKELYANVLQIRMGYKTVKFEQGFVTIDGLHYTVEEAFRKG